MSQESKIEDALKADVRMFSGCKDEQTSADVSNVASFNLPANSGPAGAGGACTNALLANVYGTDQELSWIGLLTKMQATLKTKGYTQIPQFSGSRKINLEGKFNLVNERSNGRQKSLFIGINYVGQQGELRGCHNDVIGMQTLLDKFGFKRDPAHQRVLMDDGRHAMPTGQNIREGFRWLIADAQAGDTLFMHYSGHGGSVRDTSGDEKDGKDETMCPVDLHTNGMIKDDEIFKELVLPLPSGALLTVLMDCCHSGSILDLPYEFTASGEHLAQVASGAAPPAMTANPSFNLNMLLDLGRALYTAYRTGNGGAVVQAGARAIAGAAGAGAGAAVARSVAQGIDIDGDGRPDIKPSQCCTVM